MMTHKGVAENNFKSVEWNLLKDKLKPMAESEKWNCIWRNGTHKVQDAEASICFFNHGNLSVLPSSVAVIIKKLPVIIDSWREDGQ